MAAEVAVREAYVGEKRNHIREGFGVYTYENQFFRYEGEWKNGKKHGHGKLQMADGTYYEGEFRDGEITGHGFKYFANNRNSYSGEFCCGEFEGQGIMNYADGKVYEGTWHLNKRDGHGVLRMNDNSMYQGYHHNHKRHGEGTQIYSNGDRYDGDWVNDKRQGHGEFKQSDGTLYDGQWRNDRYHGQGTMIHCSGIVYEGLWINGLPANLATKLQIKTLQSPHEVIQGQMLDITVLLVNEEGELVEENGRELRISAGFRSKPEKPPKPNQQDNSSVGLFDVIEDMEEKPIPTPFGYSIVNYPLTDNINPDDLTTSNESSIVGMSRSKTEVSGVSLPENEQAVFGPESQVTKSDQEDQIKTDSSETGEENSSSAENALSEQAEPEEPSDGVTMPPPVSNQRSQNGCASFRNLVLPAAPPLYRPFLMSDMEEMREKGGSRAGSRKGRRSTVLVHEDRSPVGRAKKLGDERYARPGEYVIMVEDITTPPFMGEVLEPTFLQIKIVLPKKIKRRATGSGLGKGPNSGKPLLLPSKLTETIPDQ